ncbi:hypothetical protein ACFL1Q_03250 [Patescibacteria group bacterium]
MFSKLEKLSANKISFIQSISLFAYISMVSVIFWKGNSWFGPINNYFGPVLVLSLLVVSALICAIIALAIPFYLVWEKKQTQKAIKVVVGTSLWMVLFFFLTLLTIILVF